MTRNEAIESIKPDACPTCRGKAFEVKHPVAIPMVAYSPPRSFLCLECTSCHWTSPSASWWLPSPQPEIVYSGEERKPPPLSKRPGSDGAKVKPDTSYGAPIR